MVNPKALLLAGAAAAVMLVPLYGDPQPSPVTHAEWARMLLRSLDLDAVVPAAGQASLVFQMLSWRTSAAYGVGDAYRREGVSVAETPEPCFVGSAAPAGEVAFRVAAPQGGDYRVRVDLGGETTIPFGLELRRAADNQAVQTLAITPPPGAEPFKLVDTGSTYLRPGLYSVAVSVPKGAQLRSVDVVPPCVNSIEPVGGWHAPKVATTADVAVTVLKALDLEHELPPAATPIEAPVSIFQPLGNQVMTVALRAEEGYALRAVDQGLQAVAKVNLPEAGLYTVWAFGAAGGGQAWVADSCHKALVCPSPDAAEQPRWRPILTTDFDAGPHAFAVTLANGASVERVRFERKKASEADYLGAVARLGLDLGEMRDVPRGLAVDAMKFVDAKRRQLGAASTCDDVRLQQSGTLVAAGFGQAAGAQIPGPGVEPPYSGTGPGPVTGPIVVPIGPSPGQPTPPPPTVSTQPPGSPVVT
jgi:hypothetical protein